MPNIRDVAKRAGVAPITVSRVINHSENVSARTRGRVEEAIRELEYMPNRLARSLRLKRTHTLALVVTDITNPFWTTVVRGVEDAAQDAGYSVILCNTDESETKQERYLDVLVQKQVDGILLVPARTDTDITAWIEKQHTPIVILDRRVSSAKVDIVRGDSESAAYQLTRHLLTLGHQRIAVLSGPEHVSTAADQVAGYCRALTEAGLNIRPDWVCTGWFSQESGYEMTRQVLNTSPRPTALFAVNNFIAIGAQRALWDSGLQVPRDMSLVVIDDLAAGLVSDPFLTVANQPAYDMGRRAAELLLARLSGSAPKDYHEIVLPVEIIVRKSSGRPTHVLKQSFPVPAIAD